MSSVRQAPRAGSQSRSVAAVYGGLSLTLLVVIASVALILKPPAPPALAEFAPQAEQTIDEGPQDQSSRFGRGGQGDCAAGQLGCEGVGRTPPDEVEVDHEEGERPEITKPRRTRCAAGDPPRQIEDPQSPPCADYWDGGDNGGATSFGVTRDEIRVAFSIHHYDQDAHTNGREFDTVRDLVPFFNNRFEFYGRRITFVPIGPRTVEAAGQQAVADQAAEEQVFAYLADKAPRHLEWRRRLAEHKILSITPDDFYTTEADLAALHPYAWNYSLTWDRVSRELAELACTSLKGRPAEHGGLEVREKSRKFGILQELDEQDYVDPKVLRDAVSTCDLPVFYLEYDDDQESAALAQARAEEVTTIIPVNRWIATWDNLLNAAIELAWEPEWLVPGGGPNDIMQEGDYNRYPTQSPHFMALFPMNKHLPVRDRPSTWAYQEQEVDTRADEDLHFSYEFENTYHSFLLLASGIQAAGPNLTPETFARAIQRLRFPNPGAGAAPYYQGSVGFTGDHSMVDDVGVAWWSSTAPARYKSPSNDVPGGWCYVGQGTRWRVGRWPREPLRLFDTGAPCQ